VSLIEAAAPPRRALCRSIFVNPMQFGPNETSRITRARRSKDAHMLAAAAAT